MELQTNRLLIKALLLSDLDNIHTLLCLPETDRYNTMGLPTSLEETKKIVENWITLSCEIPKQKYIFTIRLKDGDFIGLIGINIGKPAYKSAEIWYKLHKDFWQKGYATETSKAILYFCFNELKLHRIEAGCAVGNIASKRVLEKIGMQMEGISRKILPIRGTWQDGYRFAILEDEFTY